MMMKVLFMGATGEIGKPVVPFLREKFNLTLTAIENGDVDGLPVTSVDICNWEATKLLVEKSDPPYDAIVLCTTASRKRNKPEAEWRQYYYEQCIEVNAKGAYHVFEAAWLGNVKKVVHIGSLTAMLGAPLYEYIDENSRDQPRDVYAASKVFAEHIGRSYVFDNKRPERGCNDARSPMQVICLRLGQPFESIDQWIEGPHQGSRMPLCAADTAKAISCALLSDIAYGVYPIVSDVDHPRIAPATYEELGYKPGWKFTTQGLIRGT